jgi:hypothetical protein
MVDCFGKIHREGILKQNNTEIDTETLSTGAYYLRVNDATKLLIKQ